uniref:Uncharacterized protein At2g03540 n=1 Tax=Arabidopsis thaliana TaxID=3702 RepID=Q9ZQ90_ARATH|nr:hypothetical protein [Arabidopsis thaliana]
MIDMGISRTSTVLEAWTNRRRRRHRVDCLRSMEEMLALKRNSRTNEQDRVLWKGKNGHLESHTHNGEQGFLAQKGLICASYTETCVLHVWRDKVDGLLARYVLQATIYTIWRERNERKHGTGLNSANRLIKWIDRHIRNQLSVLKISGDHRYNKGLQVWFTSRGIN